MASHEGRLYLAAFEDRRKHDTMRCVSSEQTPAACHPLREDKGRPVTSLPTMITLHAGESDGALILWGEASRDDGVNAASPRRRGMKDAYASPHPFAAGVSDLAQALEQTALAPMRAAIRACRVTAWLPTKAGNPVPSSGLIAEPSASRARRR